MLVPAKPFLQLRPLLVGAESEYVSPWANSAFFHTGSDALAMALDYLKIPAGAKVVLPAMICCTVPDLLIRHGLKPYFIDASADSPSPDIVDMSEACDDDQVKMMLLVDFFGFLPDGREPLAERARCAGCTVVEDRCHSAFTHPENEVADAIIFSLRKSIPATDGGALLLVNEECPEVFHNALPAHRDILFLVMRLLERLVIAAGRPNIYAGFMSGMRRRIRDSACSEGTIRPAQRSTTSFAPSWLLSRQLRHAKSIALNMQRRRENYQRLARELSDVKHLFGVPDEITVPQVFPFLDTSGGMVDYLRRHGVGAYRWPGEELPAKVRTSPARFPNATRLNREIVCLPVHQSIKTHHIERMVELVDHYRAAGR